jgi:hypothetical protein
LEQPIKVPADALEVLPSVHFISVVQDEDGLGVGVHGVPKREGRPPQLGISVSARAITSAAMSGHDDDDPADPSSWVRGKAAPLVEGPISSIFFSSSFSSSSDSSTTTTEEDAPLMGSGRG